MGQRHHQRRKPKFSGATGIGPFKIKSPCECSLVVSLLKSPYQIKNKTDACLSTLQKPKLFGEALPILVSLLALHVHPQNRRGWGTATRNWPIVQRTAGPSERHGARGSSGEARRKRCTGVCMGEGGQVCPRAQLRLERPDFKIQTSRKGGKRSFPKLKPLTTEGADLEKV